MNIEKLIKESLIVSLDTISKTINSDLFSNNLKKASECLIDTYNKKVKDINKAVDNYNKVNTKLNKDRQNIINKLNTTNENFLAKHIPND